MKKFPYQSGLGVTQRGIPRRSRTWGKYRAVVLDTFVPGEGGNDTDQVVCDILMVRSQAPLYGVQVLSPVGVNDANPWIPKPTTATFSGLPLRLRVRSKRGDFEGAATPIDDMNGDHVVVEFIDGDTDYPIIVGKLLHEATKRTIKTGSGWSNTTQDAQRGNPEKDELYLRHAGSEARVNSSGDVLLDTVGATQDLVGEIPAPTGGEVRVRLKRGREFVIAGGSIAGAGEQGGAELLAASQDELEAIDIRLANGLVAISVDLTTSEIKIGDVTHTIPAAGLSSIDMLSGTQAFLKGTLHAADLTILLTALATYIGAIQPTADPGGAATGALATAITVFTTALNAPGGHLSLTIKGE